MLDKCVVYDEETLPNAFALSACSLGNVNDMFTFEISFRRNDLASLVAWIYYLRDNGFSMIGYNNLAFDYPILHMIMSDPATATVEKIFAKSQQIIGSQDRFGQQIWQSDRVVKQIDLLKIHHFDNKAKTQSLKGLEFNMRSHSVQDMPVEHGTFLTSEQVDVLIGYNRHDVSETNRFAMISEPNLDFRRDLTATLQGDVMNFNDTKIGKQTFEQRLGEDRCYTRSPSGRKEPRQTLRPFIKLADILFPYIRFEHPEFQRVHAWLYQQVLTETKAAFAVDANVGDLTFHFGTGGMHASVEREVFRSDMDYSIEDIDVAALYPSIAIVNDLYPEHLGPGFVEVYKGTVAERKNHKKGSVLNALYKLANNGVYGDSNNVYSSLYDPQYTMAVTINGQLMICMLAEQLIKIPTVRLIQVNTDGITYRIRRDFIALARKVETDWEALTRLELERASYKAMYIRDVNNYVAEYADTKKEPKLKGAYWFPRKFPDDISNASPSAWYKDLSALVVQRAAEAAMIYGIDPEIFVAVQFDPFDFMLRAKANRGDKLLIGDTEVQRITRYFIAKQGGPMRIIRPPNGPRGGYKRKNGIDDTTYHAVASSIEPGIWDARIHTANNSKYDDRETGIQTGFVVAECNVANSFDWNNLNRQWYVDEAKKLIIKG